jgi:signal transduction histidine kinase
MMNAGALAPPDTTRRRAADNAILAPASGPFLISTQRPGRTQLVLARVVTAGLVAAFLLTLAFQHVQVPRLNSFIPVVNTVIGLNDFLTAFLLYAQYTVTRARAHLVLASGFLFKTLMLIPHAVTFPGVFGEMGLLGSRLQSTTWMFPAQQIAFVMCAIAYTLLSDRNEQRQSDDETTATRLVVTIGGTITAAAFITWFLIAADAHLPRLIAADGVHASDEFRRIVVPMELILCATSIVVLRRRSRSMIDLWLKVAILAWVFEALLTMVVTGRFTMIFYATRAMGMVSSGFMLVALLSESLMLHRRLVMTAAGREHEREGHRTTLDMMVGALAHELRQPLTAIMINGQAGDVLLSVSPDDVGEARAAFRDITRSVERANEVIDSVRTMFARSSIDREMLDVNDLVREVVGIMRLEVEAYRITLALDLSPDVPAIRGHRGQLMQVLMNGMKNAVESLAMIGDGERHLRVCTVATPPHGVEIRIEDAGRGVEAAVRDHVFEPFYSTKPRGMGLGLSICRSIVETHEGALTLLPVWPRGAVFQVVLPTQTHSEELPTVGTLVGISPGVYSAPTPRPFRIVRPA